MTLISSFSDSLIEAGIDEAGRGALAGPVVAAAVILSRTSEIEGINDSKKLTPQKRKELVLKIKMQAVAYAVSIVNHWEIDKLNILNATFKAMNEAILNLKVKPELVLVDGNQFKNWCGIRHHCIIKGDQKFQSIAAASILAKVTRDEIMMNLHQKYPLFNFAQNKGYPTKKHQELIKRNGISIVHRKSFTQHYFQLTLY